MASKSRLLRVRLAPDHWVWEIKDSLERGDEVRKALEFYERFKDEDIERALDIYHNFKPGVVTIRKEIQEIKALLKEGAATGNKEREEEPDDDKERLFRSMDQLLQF